MRDRRVFITIGCHPHYADRMRGSRMDQLGLLVSVAIAQKGYVFERAQFLPLKLYVAEYLLRA